MDQTHYLLGLGALVACAGVLLLVYGFFVLSSIAIARSRSSRLRELAREGYPGARFARLVLTHADRYLLTCHLGTFLSALLTGLCLGEIGIRLAQEPLRWCPDTFSYYCVVVGLIAFVGIFGIVLVQIAKAIGFSRPTRTLCIVSLPLIVIGRLTSPIVLLLGFTIDKVLSGLGVSIPVERELAVSAEEISEIVEMSSKAGQIEDDERQMIQHVFAFSDTIVREVMTPRKDIIYVEETASLVDVVQIFVQERLSRILVTGESLDDVKGVLIVKDLLPFVGRSLTDTGSQNFELKKLIRPAFFVANSKKIDELLSDLRRDAIHFAVVLDEHGGVDGVVTLEDLVEEIVGEIFDEFDSPHEEQEVTTTQGGDLIVDGSLIIDDLNARYGFRLPKGNYDTVAGFVIDRLGHIPHVGEIAEYHGLQLKVEETEQNRILRLRISRSKKSSRFKRLADQRKDKAVSS